LFRSALFSEEKSKAVVLPISPPIWKYVRGGTKNEKDFWILH